jgi:carboxyl-terminal processing protease
MERKLIFWALVGLVVVAATFVTKDLLSTYTVGVQDQSSQNEEPLDQLLIRLEEAYAKTVNNFYQPDRAQQQELISGAIRGANLEANGMEVRDWAAQAAFEAEEAERNLDADESSQPPEEQMNQETSLENILIDSYMNGESIQQFIKRFRESLETARSTMTVEEFVQYRPVVEAAIRSMISTLEDQYSRYNTREQYESFTGDLNGEYQGIGAYIGTRNGRITIISPIKNGPAENAGIRAGDTVLFIDGQDTINFSQDEAARNLRGQAGTVVIVDVERSDGQTQSIEITRDRIKIPSVEFALIDDTIGKVSINRFGRDTPQEVKNALADLQKNSENELSGLIIDLRSNGGGYLQAAKEIGSLFVDRGGNILIEKGRTSTTVHESYDNNRKNLPIAVIIDGGTASASEILAGAIRDNEMGILVGRQTFGKGVVQTPFFLSDGSAVILTTSEWYTAGEHAVDSIGLMPASGYEVAGWLETWGELSGALGGLRELLPESLTESDSATAALFTRLSDVLNEIFSTARDDDYEASLLQVDQLMELMETDTGILLSETGIALQEGESEAFTAAYAEVATEVDPILSEMAYRLENNDIKSALEWLRSPEISGMLCPCEVIPASTSSEN